MWKYSRNIYIPLYEKEVFDMNKQNLTKLVIKLSISTVTAICTGIGTKIGYKIADKCDFREKSQIKNVEES